MNELTNAPALTSTPTEATFCPACRELGTGARFPSRVPTFAHCSLCGSTDLLDQRSPFEVLAEARALVAEPGLDPGLRWAREDTVTQVEAVCKRATCECGDCRGWRARTGFGAPRAIEAKRITVPLDALTGDEPF